MRYAAHDICPTTDLFRNECGCERCKPKRVEPGLHDGIPDTTYHADKGTLSSTGARAILANPARFKYELDHGGRPNKPEYDEGHAAHKYVLGVGEKVRRVEHQDWRTKAARDAKSQAYAAGEIPLLAAKDDAAREMARVVRNHPKAGELLAEGIPEQSAYWVDANTGVGLRARPDWRLGNTIVDYKTSMSADPDDFLWSIWKYGYFMQAAFYIDGLTALEVVENPEWYFVVQEKTAPYLVSVIQIPARAIALGRTRNREAIDLYAKCRADDHWPGYPDQAVTVDLPSKAYYSTDDEEYFTDEFTI